MSPSPFSWQRDLAKGPCDFKSCEGSNEWFRQFKSFEFRRIIKKLTSGLYSNKSIGVCSNHKREVTRLLRRKS